MFCEVGHHGNRRGPAGATCAAPAAAGRACTGKQYVRRLKARKSQIIPIAAEQGGRMHTGSTKLLDKWSGSTVDAGDEAEGEEQVQDSYAAQSLGRALGDAAKAHRSMR